MTKSLRSPAAAHFESVAGSRPTDYYAELDFSFPAKVGRLLDARCASGRLTLRLAQRAGFTVGVDLSCELVELARRFEREQGTQNVAWVVGDMEQLPFQSESFDVVASTNAVRLTSLSVTLEQLARLVRPGGRMAIQDILTRPHPLGIYYPYIARTVRSTPRYLRLYGPLMMLRILAYRFSPAELRRAGIVGHTSLQVLEEFYQRAAPGSEIHTNRWGYLALWKKSLDAQNQL